MATALCVLARSSLSHLTLDNRCVRGVLAVKATIQFKAIVAPAATIPGHHSRSVPRDLRMWRASIRLTAFKLRPGAVQSGITGMRERRDVGIGS